MDYLTIYVSQAGRSYGDRVSRPVEVTVLAYQLLANIVRYLVDTSMGEIAVDLLNRPSEQVLERGAKVELAVNREDVRDLGG